MKIQLFADILVGDKKGWVGGFADMWITNEGMLEISYEGDGVDRQAISINILEISQAIEILKDWDSKFGQGKDE